MSAAAPDLSACDREPIHIPGAIQPHGIMLVADRNGLTVTHAAGDVEGRLAAEWRGRALGELIGDALAQRIARMSDSDAAGGFVGQLDRDGLHDVSARLSGEHLLIELEPAGAAAGTGPQLLARLEAAGAAFDRTTGLKGLCERAAVEFRRLTGFDRVMIYQFQDDAAGAVLAEDRAPGLPSFLNHHFPASDIPRQARALYLRNLVRVIPDASYQPAPLRPHWPAAEPLDMSDCALRSVSPVHLQYLKNMGVVASASVSIVVDGALWGLVACHHDIPHLLPYELRAGCRALAGVLARQIKAKEAAADYQSRFRLRGMGDDLLEALASAQSLDEGLAASAEGLRRMLDADCATVLRAGVLRSAGHCPAEHQVRAIAEWALARASAEPFATSRLSENLPDAAAYREKASGLLAVLVSAEEPFLLLWFRAEHVEVVDWAGNPHKAATLAPGEVLTPRASFEAWSETVRGQARPWTLPEIEAAARLARGLLEIRQARRLRELNQRLSESLSDKEALLQQKDYLLREVNHRVQNSLQLVSSFLSLQAHDSGDADVRTSLEEAQRRVTAVALVHRRLYRADQVESIDLARYLEQLTGEMTRAMGSAWEGQLSLDLAPILVPADRAIYLGLILTELLINAQKYAYGGAPGPIQVALEKQRANLRLLVADGGRGKHHAGEGFGSRMMAALVTQLEGELTYGDNHPGLCATLTAPIGEAG